jgi:hypothetical protein
VTLFSTAKNRVTRKMPLTAQVFNHTKRLSLWAPATLSLKYSIQASLKRRPARHPLAICPKRAEGLPASVSAKLYSPP